MMPFTFQPLTNHHKTFLDTVIYFYYPKSELNIETTLFVSLRVPLDSICLLRLKNMKEQYYMYNHGCLLRQLPYSHVALSPN